MCVGDAALCQITLDTFIIYQTFNEDVIRFASGVLSLCI